MGWVVEGSHAKVGRAEKMKANGSEEYRKVDSCGKSPRKASRICIIRPWKTDLVTETDH